MPETEPDPVRQYLDRIGQTELLTAEDEVRLAKTMELGTNALNELVSKSDKISEGEMQELLEAIEQGAHARQQFIEANLRLVVSIAKRYVHKVRTSELLDLVQEGNMGLHTAVDKFDYRRGFKFSTYATWWITQAITRSLSNNERTIRVPVQVEDNISTVIKTKQLFYTREGREPDAQEIAEESGLSIQKVKNAVEVLSSTADIVSLNNPVSDDEMAAELVNFIEDTKVDIESEILHEAGESQLFDLLRNSLDEREIKVMILRYGIGGAEEHTLEQLGKVLGVTRERIRQIETSALMKMREYADKNKLEVAI